ncbi:6-bladed beta-propeller [candidate division KSB1 bacterium]
MKKLLFLLVIVFNSIFINCSSGPENSTTETVDGVRYVHNLAPLLKDAPKIELELIHELGSVDEPDENYQFFKVYSVLYDNEGCLYVLDSGNGRVQKFGADGKYLQTLGSMGEGPGEFNMAHMLEIDKNGLIYVSDQRGMKIEIFDKEGNNIDRIKLNSIIINFRIVKGEYIAANLAYLSYSPLDPGDEYKLITVLDRDMNTVNRFGGIIKDENIRLERFINSVWMDKDFDDNIYITFENHNRIEKYDSEGRLLLRIDQPIGYTIENGFVNRTVEGRSVNSLNLTTVTGNISVDGKGRMWVSTYLSQAEYDADSKLIKPADRNLSVFDPEGVLLCRIPYPGDNMAFIRILGDKAFFTDKEYVTVYVYNIKDK